MFKYILAFILGATLGIGAMHYYKKGSSCASGIINERHCDLRRYMRKLWADHVIWMRQFIVSSVAGLQDVDPVLKRLLQNQEDIGSFIAQYYGKDTGSVLAQLLKKQIDIATDIVIATAAKDIEKMKILDAQWQAHAAEIAVFLSKINPYWNQKDLTAALNEHLKLVISQVHLRLDKKWAEDIASFDAIFKQARGMAKNLADGITKQFPAKF